MSCQFTNEPNREISRGVFQNRGVCGQAFPLLPSSSPFHLFFCSRSNFRAITQLEMLATQAIGPWEWALIWGWALIKFSPFSTSVVCIFCKKTVSGNNKTWRRNKARLLQDTLKKTRSSGKSQISTYSFFGGGSGKGVGAYLSLSGIEREVGWGGVGVGAYSRLGAY